MGEITFDVQSKSRSLTQDAISLTVEIMREESAFEEKEEYDVMINRNGDISISPEPSGKEVKEAVENHCKKRKEVAFPKE